MAPHRNSVQLLPSSLLSAVARLFRCAQRSPVGHRLPGMVSKSLFVLLLQTMSAWNEAEPPANRRARAWMGNSRPCSVLPWAPPQPFHEVLHPHTSQAVWRETKLGKLGPCSGALRMQSPAFRRCCFSGVLVQDSSCWFSAGKDQICKKYRQIGMERSEECWSKRWRPQQ